MRVIAIVYTLFSVAAFGSIVIFFSDGNYLETKKSHVLKIIERINTAHSDEPIGGVVSTTNNIPGDTTITSRAYVVWRETRYSGIPIAQPEEKHYTFTLYDQPIGTSTYFDIRIKNAANRSKFIVGRVGGDADTAALDISLENEIECMDRVVCSVPRDGFNHHFAHFAQLAFPCWSALQRFPTGKRYLRSWVPPTSLGWNGELVAAFEKAGIQILGYDNKEPPGKDRQCQWELEPTKTVSAWPVSPTLEKGKDGNLLLKPNHNDYKWRKDPVFYFSRQSEMAELQHTILDSKYRPGVSNRTKIQLLILNRSGTRHFSNGETIASSIKNSTLGDIIDVVHVQEMKGNLYEQVLIMHSADIVISPHGAQLANLAFIKPCTVVAEVFPRGYYLQFFQSYVVTAGGIAFEGYENGRSPYFDLLGIEDGKLRGQRRDGPIPLSAASVVRALPEFIIKFNTCRSNYV